MIENRNNAMLNANEESGRQTIGYDTSKALKLNVGQ